MLQKKEIKSDGRGTVPEPKMKTSYEKCMHLEAHGKVRFI